MHERAMSNHIELSRLLMLAKTGSYCYITTLYSNIRLSLLNSRAKKDREDLGSAGGAANCVKVVRSCCTTRDEAITNTRYVGNCVSLV